MANTTGGLPGKGKLPSVEEIERAVLGSVLQSGQWAPEVKLDMFYHEKNKVAFVKLEGLHQSGLGVDLATALSQEWPVWPPDMLAWVAGLPMASIAPEHNWAKWVAALKAARHQRRLYMWAKEVQSMVDLRDWEGLDRIRRSPPVDDSDSGPTSGTVGGVPEAGEPEPDVKKAVRTLSNRKQSGRVIADEVLRTDTRWTGAVWWDDFKKRRCIGERAYQDVDDQRISLWLAKVYRVDCPPESISKIVAAIAADNVRDPLGEYLNGVAWDGSPRLESWLVDGLGVEASPLVATIGRRWLIQAVARALRPGCKADATLVLTGKQGAQKSSALRALIGPEFFSDSPILLGEVRGIQQAHSAWGHELSELSSLRGRAVEDVKAFLTTQSDTFIQMYGRQPVTWARRCFFCGTTNEDTFLGDPTGARRFWPVRVGKVDLDWIKLNRDQIWAEAVVAYRAGEIWHLEQAEEEQITEAREEFQREDLWAGRIAKWLTIPEVKNRFAAELHDSGDHLTSDVVLSDCLKLEAHQLRDGMAERVGRILTKQVGLSRLRSRINGILVWWYPLTK